MIDACYNNLLVRNSKVTGSALYPAKRGSSAGVSMPKLWEPAATKNPA